MYDGTRAVVRSEHLAAEEIEFLRWRAERWMKRFVDGQRHPSQSVTSFAVPERFSI